MKAADWVGAKVAATAAGWADLLADHSAGSMADERAAARDSSKVAHWVAHLADCWDLVQVVRRADH